MPGKAGRNAWLAPGETDDYETSVSFWLPRNRVRYLMGALHDLMRADSWEQVSNSVYTPEQMSERFTDWLASYEVGMGIRPLSVLAQLPGLTGYWPGAYLSPASSLLNAAPGLSTNLTQFGDPVVAMLGRMTVLRLPAGNNYYSGTAGALKPSGAEVMPDTSIRGVTLMAWVRFDTGSTGATESIAGVMHNNGQHSYGLWRNVGGNILAGVSGNGTALVAATGVLSGTGWNFVCLRYRPSAPVGLYQNGIWYETVSNAPASLHPSTSGFYLGARNSTSGVTQPMTGYIAHPALFAASLPREEVERVYRDTRWMAQ